MNNISVSVVYATAEKQWLNEYRVQRGTSAQELIEKSNYLNEVGCLNGIELNTLKLGVFAEKIKLDYLLEEGDRLEIYRPLTADPKEVRRQLALLGKTIGGKNKD